MVINKPTRDNAREGAVRKGPSSKGEANSPSGSSRVVQDLLDSPREIRLRIADAASTNPIVVIVGCWMSRPRPALIPRGDTHPNAARLAPFPDLRYFKESQN